MRGVVTNGTYWKHENEKDKLRMAGGAWSINLDEFDVTDPAIVFIVFETDKATYKIDRLKALSRGFTRDFKIKGTDKYEKKLIVSIRHWNVMPKKGG